MDEREKRIIEICQKNGKNKSAAIKEVNDEFHLGLIFAKQLVDEVYNSGFIPVNNSGKPQTIGIYNVTYKGGHPALTKEKDCTLTVNSDCITISYGFSKGTIPVANITNCALETQDQLERRITATRLLTLGVFALAFKKKSKSTEKYLSIDFTNENGIDSTVLFSGKNVPKAHSGVYKALNLFKQSMPNEIEQNEPINTSVQNDPYEELKKCKELLDMGILTQEEFDAKKERIIEFITISSKQVGLYKLLVSKEGLKC